ncbi:uncharacterized protein LOC122652429 [Telopea speciosissima]|uniref:uncharacterized protein LOC122652429 n=1 Tax=Telopea speciosissima TaxID=54955 RepID=UPI001CC6F4FE|nr:uncharacterized protein LOC122652429 [Telopea speciosissima]
MVRSWLVHSTIASIAHSILWIDSAREVWLDLHERFSQKNVPRIFEIRQAISTDTQGSDSVSAYYTVLKGYCDELTSYRSLPTCSCGAMNKLQELLRIDSLMDFLQGFNESYTAIRSQILLMDPFPTLAKAYSLLLQEERQRSLHTVLPASIEQSAMAVTSTHQKSSRPKPFYHCTYCNMETFRVPLLQEKWLP